MPAPATSCATERVKAMDRPLGRAVVRAVRALGRQTGDGGRVDDAPIALRLHQLERLPRAIEHALDVHAPVAVPLFIGDFGGEVQRVARHWRAVVGIQPVAPFGVHRAVGRERGVVDQDVQAAKARPGGVEHLAHRLAVRHVAAQRQAFGAIGLDVLARGGDGFVVDIAHHHAGPGAGQPDRDALAEPRSDAGHQGDAPFEIGRHLRAAPCQAR